MIAFSCAQCGMKFSVRPEFAGRSTRCSTCKQPLTVPQEALVAAAPPSSRLDGPLSSLARAGIAAEVTVACQATDQHDDTARPIAEVLKSRNAEGQRYLLEGELARGGMGAVLRAVDCDIRREVAVKYLLDQSDPRKKARFVEEAQITGQLEHPNIVPIHELGIDARQHLFFSMKMVKGRSLQYVLQELRDVPHSAEKEYGLGRLLTIFVGICNALAYAHARGVVHRDLKPANIMIGDFGEVYVMDWGLAKVLSPELSVEQPASVIQSAPSFDWAGEEQSSGSSTSVQTDRTAEEDKTLDGTVIGTPLYMPPEQALGHVTAIDERSDIYALGALLYEMLSLQPPVDRTGGFHAILLRVTQGEIVPPEIRAPERARRIPSELSAVAMKALAKNKNDRYPTVEALRRDIELYLEGRSVSAREDTKRELLWKFIKRNRGFSAGMAAALLVLVGSLFFIGQAWLRAEAARRTAEAHYAAYQREQQDKQERTRKAVPALVEAARLAAQNNAWEDALMQLDLAQSYDPEYAAIELVRSQIQIGKLDFAAACESLRRYVKKRPRDAEANELLQLCQQVRSEDGQTLLAITEVLVRQRALGATNALIAVLSKRVRKQEQLMPLFRKRINASWPGLGGRLSVRVDGGLQLNLYDCRQVGDLTPLQGMPLTWLNLLNCTQVRDLSPLQGMPLTWLQLDGCAQIRDLSPLQGMPLAHLDLSRCAQVRDLSPLKGMPLTWLSINNCDQVQDLSPLKGMSLIRLTIGGRGIADLSPLEGMPLKALSLSGVQVRDLSPLKGMSLNQLNLFNCFALRDLSPLKGMPLTVLTLSGCGHVNDLSPLKDMPLNHLNFFHCYEVRDLSSLKGMPLTGILYLPPKVDRGMDVLRSIKTLNAIEGMSADEFWKKYDAGEFPQHKP